MQRCKCRFPKQLEKLFTTSARSTEVRLEPQDFTASVMHDMGNCSLSDRSLTSYQVGREHKANSMDEMLRRFHIFLIHDPA